ncbi:transposase domain-containing protein [Rhizophagus clarus]|uniref:Transposase domain-containing protein n=1 Tax=Rhizophagus clarus TaxID=94130 RepID=A0A8H3LYS0_9GLOM|nr:transposase domain-containing protein [Rhizophagus clarus]
MTDVEDNGNLDDNESIYNFNDTENLKVNADIENSKNMEKIKGENRVIIDFNNTESESDNYDYDSYEEDDNINHENINDKDVSIGMKLLETKVKHGLTDTAFNSVLSNIGLSISLYKLQKKLHQSVSLSPIRIDTCKNSCIAFTGDYHLLRECPLCFESRFDSNNKPVNITNFFSLIERLKIQFSDSKRAKEFLYRYEYTTTISNDNGNYDDIYDGKLYKKLVERGLFANPTDIALSLSLDGFQIFKHKTNDYWVILFINNNLSPEIRVKKENLLITMVIPGPNAPKDMSTFLQPIINELQVLEEGILCFNGYTQQQFLLKAYVTHCTGDIPAISKCLNLVGHNAYKGCRFCNLLGTCHIKNHHIYFPLNKQHGNLVLRTHEEAEDTINQLLMETDKSKKESIIKNTGIKGANLLFKLKGIEFPWSFPTDIMHLYFENIALLMYLHWSGGFFKDNKYNKNSYNLTKKELEYIGKLMKESQTCLPLEFGRALRDISKYHTGFKAVEWRNWIELFSVPLLKDIFIDKHINGWINYVKAVKLSLKYVISNDDLQEIKCSLITFYNYYENEYFKQDQERLSACRICFHYLLHISENIEYSGPCWAYWQFPMERLCGMLIPMVYSKLRPYTSLSNNLTLLDQLNHLQYTKEGKSIISNSECQKKWTLKQVYGAVEDYDEEFYWPSCDYILNEKESKALQKFYSNKNIELHGIKYGRLLTRDGHTISSEWIKRNKPNSRNNYSIQIRYRENEADDSKIENL